jgi:hypothetical protein
LVPLWALGLGAVAGFPLDELWHRAYGVDVTMWSPTHMLMILGATFTGMAAWLILAGSGVRPTTGGWGRAAHLVCGWLTIQGLLAPMGEFTFGVPQFSLLFAPILVSLAAGLGLLAFRLVHGAWWTLGLVVVNFGLQATAALGGDESPVTERFGATFLASAVVVEVAARVLGTKDRTRLALVTGLGIGTVGLAAEWVWNQDARQAWASALLPELGLFQRSGDDAAEALSRSSRRYPACRGGTRFKRLRNVDPERADQCGGRRGCAGGRGRHCLGKRRFRRHCCGPELFGRRHARVCICLWRVARIGPDASQ